MIHTLVYINLFGKALNLRQQSFLFFLQENGLICLCFLFSVKIVFCKYFVERKSEKIVLKADGWGRCYTYISAFNLKKMKYHFLTDQKQSITTSFVIETILMITHFHGSAICIAKTFRLNFPYNTWNSV